MLRLDLKTTPPETTFRGRLGTIYEQIAGSDDYQRNDRSLRLIQISVVTVSAIATGGVNAFAHQARIGWAGAVLLAILIMGFVEKFYFTLRHGLATTYRGGRQRLAATLCYRTIQATMVLNAATLCVWIVGIEMPAALRFWVHWSIAIHFALALVGVSAVRDSDAVVENRIRELRTASAEEDIVAIRRSMASNNPLLILAAKLRGLLDGLQLAYRLLRHASPFPPIETGDLPKVPSAPAASGNASPMGKVRDIGGKFPRR